MAHKKGQGSSHNGRESESKRLGVKRADGQSLEYVYGKGYEFVYPKMIIDPRSNNFYDFSIDDFKLEGYEPIKPQLKLELGI